MSANVSASTVRSATTVVSGKGVLSATVVAWGSDDMAASVSCLIGLKVIEWFGAAARHWPGVSVVRVKAVIHVTMEAYRSMEPRPSSKEHATGKPVRPIVPIGSAIIGRVIEISIRTNRSRTNIHSYSNL
jgi:hypothetical protein